VDVENAKHLASLLARLPAQWEISLVRKTRREKQSFRGNVSKDGASYLLAPIL